MEEVKRIFIAIPLPEAVKRALDNVCEQLQQQFPSGSVRWVQADNMHLTLRFLGDTAVSQIPGIITQLDQLCPKPVRLQLHQLGCFPNQSNPRVLWVGLKGELAELQQLKRDVDRQLAALSWPPETKPFTPHLTIGRVKDARKAGQVRWRCEVDEAHFGVTAVHLIQSDLQKQGPVYTTLHKITF